MVATIPEYNRSDTRVKLTNGEGRLEVPSPGDDSLAAYSTPEE
jgi:hypothetical protein